MYLTAAEYVTLTGKPIADANTVNIYMACKLLDSRIGNYGELSTGWKIDDTASTWYVQYDINNYNDLSILQYNNKYEVTAGQKQAIKMWVAGMISAIALNGASPNTSKNVKLGRFSVGSGSSSGSQIMPESMGYYDSILISSGIINRKVNLL